MFPFKYEVIDTLVETFTRIIKQKKMDPEQEQGMMEKTWSGIPSGILALYLMYIRYDNKQEIVDHVRLNKMSVYDIKFPYDEARKEYLTLGCPQILTSSSEFDKTTNYFGEYYIDLLVDNTLGNEKELHTYFMLVLKEKYPKHFVIYQFFLLKIFSFNIFRP